MKQKKDYSKIFGFTVVVFGSLYLGIETGIAACNKNEPLAVFAFAFIIIAVVSVIEIIEEVKK